VQLALFHVVSLVWAFTELLTLIDMQQLSEEFSYVFSRSVGEPLGLGLITDADAAVFWIETIKEGSVAQRQNAYYLSMPVLKSSSLRVGDCVICVNGMRGDVGRMREKLDTATWIHMRVVRWPTSLEDAAATTKALAAATASAPRTVSSAEAASCSVFSASTAAAWTVTSAEANAGGVFCVSQSYSEGEEGISGYLTLQRGELVRIDANTLDASVLGLPCEEYVYGSRVDCPSATGWLPTAILGLPVAVGCGTYSFAQRQNAYNLSVSELSSSSLRVGDCAISVNGVRGDVDRMREKLAAATWIHMCVVRRPTSLDADAATEALAAVTAFAPPTVSIAEAASRSVFSASAAAACTVTSAEANAGGVFLATQPYSEGEDGISGYLTLGHDEHVRVYANTLAAGVLGNAYEEYVYGYRMNCPCATGWLPTAILASC
jgi:hypothetical protein